MRFIKYISIIIFFCIVSSCYAEDYNFPEPVNTLKTKITPIYGKTFANPGETLIELIATPEAAYMTATEKVEHTNLKWLTLEGVQESGQNIISQPWECKKPHQAFTYTLSARAEIGSTIFSTIRFHAHLTSKWCSKAKKNEEIQKNRERRKYEEEIKQTEKNERISAETERKRIEEERHKFESNCIAIGGTPVHVTGQFEIVCKAPNGGTLIVPN